MHNAASLNFYEDSYSLKKTKKTVKRTKEAANFSLFDVDPITENQEKTFRAYESGKNLMLHGVAGTGKTFISLYLALESTLKGRIDKPVVIIRSVVPTRDIGFLPGSMEEKIAVYEQPYDMMCSELFRFKGAYNELKKRGFVEFSTTSFLRGLTFHNNTIVVDECQNLTFVELDTIMTRCGEGCRIIFCGDFRQSDLYKSHEREGLKTFMNIVNRMNSFEFIEFSKDDIVRSALVKEYIEARLEEGIV
jgi:predicted ribonuclease YlaK